MRLIVFFILLIPATIAIAEQTESPSQINREPEISESVTTDPDVTQELSLHYPSIDSLFTLYQPYLDNISAYQPIYFLVGTDPGESKFQFSFKYRLLDLKSPLTERYRFMNGVHFAYTQTSYWDLSASSLPFEDTSYKPELFFISPNIDTGLSRTSGLFVQTGIQHESNGQGGEDSRSTNFLYVRPIFVSYDTKTTFGFLIAPKVWAYVNNAEDTNQNLPDYRGYFDIELKFGLAQSLVVGSNFSWAREGASIQLDVTYPMNRIFPGISGVYLHIQFVDTLAESLLKYEERTEAFRIGVSIVR